jgi:ABC-type antimicrobial peptide transport system permease subunit
MKSLHRLAIRKYTKTNCNTSKTSVPHADHIAFEFSRLGAITDFREEMMRNFEVEVSMQQVEASNNFHLVSVMTNAISIVLFGFAALSIAFYILSLIRTHITKSAPNIGTLKAFGISDKTLRRTYISIVGIFLITASAIAFILCIIVQLVMTSFGDIPIKLNVFDPLLPISLVLIMLVCLVIASRAAKSLLSNTPGDLVYRRI